MFPANPCHTRWHLQLNFCNVSCLPPDLRFNYLTNKFPRPCLENLLGRGRFASCVLQGNEMNVMQIYLRTSWLSIFMRGSIYKYRFLDSKQVLLVLLTLDIFSCWRKEGKVWFIKQVQEFELNKIEIRCLWLLGPQWPVVWASDDITLQKSTSV